MRLGRRRTVDPLHDKQEKQEVGEGDGDFGCPDYYTLQLSEIRVCVVILSRGSHPVYQGGRGLYVGDSDYSRRHSIQCNVSSLANPDVTSCAGGTKGSCDRPLAQV